MEDRTRGRLAASLQAELAFHRRKDILRWAVELGKKRIRSCQDDIAETRSRIGASGCEEEQGTAPECNRPFRLEVSRKRNVLLQCSPQ